jgi:hypothetical protein
MERLMKKNDFLRGIGLVACAAGLLLILNEVNVATNNFVILAITNFGHVPLFGFLALILHALFTLAAPRRHPLQGYAFAFVIACIIGLGSEIAQIPAERDADIVDFIRDIIGAASFLAFRATCDKRCLWFHKGAAARRRGIARAGALALVLLSAAPVFVSVASLAVRAARFPLIADFDSPFLSSDIKTHKGASMSILPAPKAFTKAKGKAVRVAFRPQAPYPGLDIAPYENWKRLSALRLDVYSELDSNVEMYIRIHDHEHTGIYTDRFSTKILIAPGVQTICIPVADIRDAPQRRVMNMKAIRRMIIFARRPESTFVLWFDNLALSHSACE